MSFPKLVMCGPGRYVYAADMCKPNANAKTTKRNMKTGP